MCIYCTLHKNDYHKRPVWGPNDHDGMMLKSKVLLSKKFFTLASYHFYNSEMITDIWTPWWQATRSICAVCAFVLHTYSIWFIYLYIYLLNDACVPFSLESFDEIYVYPFIAWSLCTDLVESLYIHLLHEPHVLTPHES